MGKFYQSELVQCTYCKQLVSRSGLVNHLKKCVAFQNRPIVTHTESWLNKIPLPVKRRSNMKLPTRSRRTIRLSRQRRMIELPTPAEDRMSVILSSLRIGFVNQKEFYYTKRNYYIVDFYLHEPYKVVIEVDGLHHYTNKRQLWYDSKRTTFLEQEKELLVLRFTNSEVLNNTEETKDKLKSILDKYKSIKGDTTA